LTIEAYLEGAGTTSAILKMVAATMGWGRLQGTFTDWSAHWTPNDPIFEAMAAGAPGPIRLRELPLRPAVSPIPRRVKAGARWTETNRSAVVAQPMIQFKALDQPVVIPTLVSLDAHVAIATYVALETIKLEGEEVIEQEVTLRLEGQLDGTLRGTLIERRLPAGETIITDVTDRIRIQTSGLRIDREGESAFLQGGSDDTAAELVISDGRRAIHLKARSEGLWGNAILVAHAAEDDSSDPAVALTYDPALALGNTPSSPEATYQETLTLSQLIAGASALVTGRDFTFTIPEGESNWLYFDHVGWTIFDVTQWDRNVFDAPFSDEEDPELIFADFPPKGVYDYVDFNQAIFPQEIFRAFRFDQPGSNYNEAFFNDDPEQVEILLGWQEGQRATIRIDVPLESNRDHQRLAFLPEMLRKIKAAGIKVILVPRFLEHQSLGDSLPRVRLHRGELQPLGESMRLRVGLTELQTLNDGVVGIFDQDHWNTANFG
jgi:hypothetical protein